MLARSPLDSGMRCRRGARNSERVPSVGAKSYRTPKTARQPLGAHRRHGVGSYLCNKMCLCGRQLPYMHQHHHMLAQRAESDNVHTCTRGGHNLNIALLAAGM